MGISGLKYILVFALSFIVSLIATPFVIRLASKLGIMDRPVDNRWHKRAVPCMGGVAIFAGFMVASAVFAPFQRETLIILLGAVVIFALGFLDDRFGTYPKIKFMVQCSVALALALLGVRLRILPAAVAIPITLLWVVGITNAFNLIDNMDGLSAGMAFIASMTFFLFSWKSGQAIVPVMALALGGACLGFLRYNFNPARVFMGDCGSLLVGYILSTFAILGFWQKSSPIFPALTIPVLILGYAVFDTTLVTVLRLKAKGPPWVGGKDHSSHRLVTLGLSDRGTVLLLYALGIVGSVSAFIVLKTSLIVGFPLVVFLFMVAAVFGWVLATKSR